ncbi:ABC transporter permease [Lichenibacterium ramalinae]|uniref:ABC transporter permease n=1 Tax=Lichenibacterium ramalinae TaxID=2316527 RepID=A0A4Q2RIG9_9HYPH|nr:ABC transporter permease [Lichenibacterium ramalinae]
MLAALRGRIAAAPWIWSFLGTAATWLVTVSISGGRGGEEIISAALTFSAFTVLVSLGQMMVITTGPGNVDLSIPSVIALSSAVAMLVMDERAGMIVPGLAAAVAAGLAVGGANYGLIRLLRIPPIIATLSSSLVVMSVAIVLGRGLKIKPPQVFADAVTTKVAGVPLLAIVALAAAVAIAFVLERTLYGRTVSAIGQSRRIARLAGLDVERASLLTYMLSGGLAGLTGALIAGFSGGNSLDQGAEYLLLTIAVVVIGGTSVSGGRASVPGIWGAALFMFLIVTMLNASGVSPGLRMLITGLIIIGVIAVGGSERAPR